MKKVLVLVSDYPNNNGKVSLMYVHTRNLYYSKHSIIVTVLNFSINNEYTYDGIRVISQKIYEKEKKDYDILILHAANIRNHYLFLKKYEYRFNRLIFFYHGHEVMKINKDYCKNYYYVRNNVFKYIFQNIYDEIKLYIWRKYLPKIINKTDLVFVSNWMLDIFNKNIKLDQSLLLNKISITYNNVGLDFESYTYDDNNYKKYDFVTIRNNFDDAKYAIDIVNRLANKTQNAKFLLIGKGKFFNYYNKADNIEWINSTMNHKDIIKMLNMSKYALMPTRTDSQGLMMCEMAAFGIPVITSDIPVCHEIFDGYDNVYYINNDDCNYSLCKFMNIKSVSKKDERYFIKNTVKNEIDIINKQ